jgi:hypothetical protein
VHCTSQHQAVEKLLFEVLHVRAVYGQVSCRHIVCRICDDRLWLLQCNLSCSSQLV